MNHKKLFSSRIRNKKTKKNEPHPVNIDRVDPEIKRHTHTHTHTHAHTHTHTHIRTHARTHARTELWILTEQTLWQNFIYFQIDGACQNLIEILIHMYITPCLIKILWYCFQKSFIMCVEARSVCVLLTSPRDSAEGEIHFYISII